MISMADEDVAMNEFTLQVNQDFANLLALTYMADQKNVRCGKMTGNCTANRLHLWVTQQPNRTTKSR
jgi:hypothetical protein